MTFLRKIRREESGAAVVEMALSLPILLLMIYGMFQVGVIMAADAGMQHALGEGARMATLYPTPADTSIKTKMESKVFGMYIGTYTVADPSTVTAGGTKYKDLAVTYTVTPNFLFFNGPQITLNRSKRVYLT
jgi:Flp pilus assembly protein TadG